MAAKFLKMTHGHRYVTFICKIGYFSVVNGHGSKMLLCRVEVCVISNSFLYPYVSI